MLPSGTRKCAGVWIPCCPSCPADTEEYAFLARRLGYEENLAQLRDDLDRHVADVLELSQKLLG